MLLAFAPVQSAADAVLPTLAGNLVCHYDFDHPVDGDAGRETDLGLSATAIRLVNGEAAMRVADAAWPGAGHALQTRQVNPAANGNDDWKAGTFDAHGVESLGAFNAAAGITVMGWVKPTGPNPNPDSMTDDPDDFFGAIGLFGILSGTSEGHLVRALLEVMNVGGALRLVALGRRDDAGSSVVLAAEDDWQALLPGDTWTHLAATFDYDEGRVALYRNGEPLEAFYTASDDPWHVEGDPEPDLSSATNPTGIKIGGSYPQNTAERNPFNGRFDDLMFFDRALAASEVRAQYVHFMSQQDNSRAD